MKITGILAINAIILGTLISACGAAAPAAPTTDPGAVYTMAAATVQAQLTQAAAANPTAAPATATETAKPAATATLQIAQQPTSPFGAVPTLSGGTAVPTLINGLNPNLAPTSAQPAGFSVGDVAQFQYNIPADNTVFAPGIPFQMEVGFKNVGSVTWTTEYSLRYTGGTQMSGVTVVPLKAAVKPGEKAIFNVDLHAPGGPNDTKTPYYLSYWHLTTQTGLAVANGDMYLKIIVKREY
ncbi:MAG TPA: NBR1-Ig-like domain-containing protein [Leptolinea sp.]